MRKYFLPLIIILIFTACNKLPKLYLAGDSTMSVKTNPESPERGWGMMLPYYFTESMTIENHAKNGRSSRSFRYEGRWDSIMALVSQGDYVLIQFGHNDDVVTKTGRHSTPEEYRYNLTEYVLDVKSHSAFPILCTPIQRRKFDSTGQLINTHGIYPQMVKEVGAEYNVPVIDMQQLSDELIESYGVEESKKLFLHYAPGEVSVWPEGREDNTHFSELGAKQMAELFIRELQIINHPLTKYLKDSENEE